MKIFAKDREGKETVIEGHGGLPITAECGGACACATCHVYIEGGWYNKLPPPSEGETDMLDMALAVQPNSRLSCQLICSEELDGIKVMLAPE
jgi:2Fe-2S ferredoxin